MTGARRAKTIFYSLVGGLLALLLGLGGFIIWNLATRNAHLNERIEVVSVERAQAYDDLIASQENAQRLYDQLLELPGVEPEGDDPEDLVTIPSPTPGAPGATGARGAPGERGSPGADATMEQVVDAVEAFCGVNACVGPTGAPGAPGRDGESIVGPQGPQGPPGESIVGPVGPAGPAGATCPEGYAMRTVFVPLAEDELGPFLPQQTNVCLPV